MRAKYACKVSAAPRKLFGPGPVRFLVQFGSVRCICIGIGIGGSSSTHLDPKTPGHPATQPPTLEACRRKLHMRKRRRTRRVSRGWDWDRDGVAFPRGAGSGGS